MRWLVTGAGGLLGTEVVAHLRRRGDEVIACGRAELDLTRTGEAARVLAAVRPDVVVNTAAWTSVDDAEEHEDAAAAVNDVGAGELAAAAASAGARLVHVSTDYVFRGDAAEPYAEDARPAPMTAYGRTKAAGERAVRARCPGALVVRTAWLYGSAGACFPRTVARLARRDGTVRVVDDQVGQPTWALDVAQLVAGAVDVGVRGVVHATAGGSTSWAGFARAVLAADGRDPDDVVPVPTAAFPRPAPRPAWSVLGHDATTSAGVRPIGHWEERWRAAAPEVLAAVTTGVAR